MVNTKRKFDGISSEKRAVAAPIIIGQQKKLPQKAGHRLIPIDGIRLLKKQPVRLAATDFTVPFRPKFSAGSYLSKVYKRVPQLAPLALALILAFGGGMWYALRTPESAAQINQPMPQVAAAETTVPIPLGSMPAQDKPDPNLSNDVLFNTPLVMLKDYLASSAEAGQLEIRKAKLHEFLKNRNSPLEPQADLIAEQGHWKLILAISFAESTLGEHCQWNNCSGIGGSQLRAYKSFDNWILDFNRLLDSHYKDDTLEQMCGVYVQPCNPHWLVATKQILTALDEQGIE